MSKIEDYIKSLSEPLFVIFVLSKGIYHLEKYNTIDTTNLCRDITKKKDIPEWMDLDVMYLFAKKNLKITVDNSDAPYTSIYKIRTAKYISLVSASKYTVMIEHEDNVDLFVFQNVTEAYKFYNYSISLRVNAIEKVNSLGYNININLRILFDDSKFQTIVNALNSLVGTYKEVNKENGKNQVIIECDDIFNTDNFIKALNSISIAYYALETPKTYRNYFEVVISHLNHLCLSPLNELIEKALLRLSEILPALEELDLYVIELNKWKIHDIRVQRAYKILVKLSAHDAVQRLCDQAVTKILDRLNMDLLYSEGKSDIMNKFLKLVQSDIQRIYKFQSFGSLEIHFAEILHKPLKYFLTHFLHILDNPNFCLDMPKNTMLMEELGSFNVVLDNFIKQLSKRMKIPVNIVEVYIRKQHVIGLIEKIKLKLKDRLLADIEVSLTDVIKNINKNKFSEQYEALFESAKSKINELNGSNVKMLNIAMIEALMLKFLNLVLEYDSSIKEKGQHFMEGLTTYTSQVQGVDCSLYLSYIKLFNRFINSTAFDDAQMSIACLHKGIDVHLTQEQLIGLIKVKPKHKNISKDKLIDSVKDHFTKIKSFDKVRQFKAINSRNLLIAFYCMKLISILKKKGSNSYLLAESEEKNNQDAETPLNNDNASAETIKLSAKIAIFNAKNAINKSGKNRMLNM